MKRSTVTQGIINLSTQETYLLTWIDDFLLDRKAQNLAKGTLAFYQRHLNIFVKFCDTQVVTRIDQLDPSLVRRQKLSDTWVDLLREAYVALQLTKMNYTMEPALAS